LIQETGAPPSLPSTAPQKTNPWIIVILVIVVVCCSCVGILGLLIGFGPAILHELGLALALPLLGSLI
jgi:hypothetical protein